MTMERFKAYKLTETPEKKIRAEFVDMTLDELDPGDVAKAQEALARSESVGQARMRALHSGTTRFGSVHGLEVSPNLWAGVGLVRGGAGTALVGSHTEVADRIAEYAALGIDEFILSGYPHLEEAYWFAEGVKPILRRRGRLGQPPSEPNALEDAPLYLSAVAAR